MFEKCDDIFNSAKLTLSKRYRAYDKRCHSDDFVRFSLASNPHGNIRECPTHSIDVNVWLVWTEASIETLYVERCLA